MSNHFFMKRPIEKFYFVVWQRLTLGNSQLEGNPYVNFFFLTISELFSTITSQYFFDRHGRKKPYVIAMTASGISLMIIYFIPACKAILIFLIWHASLCIIYTCIYIYIFDSLILLDQYFGNDRKVRNIIHFERDVYYNFRIISDNNSWNRGVSVLVLGQFWFHCCTIR